jgi:hypothetical protein
VLKGGTVTTFAIPRRLSPSSLDRYRCCPRRFLWQDIERRPFEQRPTPESLLGTKGTPFTTSAYRAWRREQQQLDLEQGRLRRIPDYHTVWKRFGTWKNALEAAFPGEDKPDQSEEEAA